MKKEFWLEDLPQEIGNKYIAINMAAKRARELGEGAMPTVRIRGRKKTTVALDEVFSGRLGYEVQPIKEKTLVPSEPVVDEDDDGVHDLPDTRMPEIDGVFKEEDDDEEENIFEAEYVDDSEFYYNADDDEYEEGI